MVMNEIITDGYEKELFKSIAKSTGNKQILKDLSFFERLMHFGNANTFAKHISGESFVIGTIHKSHIRIYGLATRDSSQGKGLASRLVNDVINMCKIMGKEKVTTRTLSGRKLYEKLGFSVVGEKDGDFLMEKTVNKNVIEETYGSPRWTGEIADCSLPVTFDTYSNCSFGCVYCFSQYQRAKGNGKNEYLEKKVKSINIYKTKKLFTEDGPKNQFYKYLSTKRPIQWGGLSDQFDGYERIHGKTLEMLKFLRPMNYPISFSTKSTWVFFDERYRALFKDADSWNMKFSIITLDEEDAKKIEVGVSSPQERLRAMKEWTTLNKGGATLRLRPFIPGVSDKTYKELIRAAHDAGATAVTTEFFCMDIRSIHIASKNLKVISDCAGFDIVDFYKKNSSGTGYLRLNRAIKAKYIKEMKSLCDELGMRFYVSDAHGKECCNNSCCCGLNTGWDYSKGNFAYALEIAKKKGFVTWADIEWDMYFLDFPFADATGFNVLSSERCAKFSGMSMKQYLRYLWNSPKLGQSPYKIFESVLIPDGFDSDGNIIYKYNDKVSFIDRHADEKEVSENV